MRTLFTISILLLPLIAGADVYKWIGPDGRAHYSDRPVSGAEPVGMQIDSGEEPSQPAVPQEKNPKEKNVAFLGPYDSFEILIPQPNQTLQDADGNVALSLLIDPPLAGDHRLQILVNDQPLPRDIPGAQIQLQGLSVGSHRVQARIQDDADTTIATTPVVDFHLRTPPPEESRPEETEPEETESDETEFDRTELDGTEFDETESDGTEFGGTEQE